MIFEISGEKPARYHTSGESLFSPVKTNPFPRASGGHIGSQVTLDKYGHAFVLTDEKPWPPTRTNQQFIEVLAF